MVNMQSDWDRPSEHFPRDAMCEMPLIALIDMKSIPFVTFEARPKPTSALTLILKINLQ
jgi:hypothetical protein